MTGSLAPGSAAPPDPRFQILYQRLFQAHGPQHWWPGETPFEIMVGAVLTQNTAWNNVERVIGRLRAANRLTPEAILALPLPELAELIRPAGYFNVKATRLRNLCQCLLDAGGESALRDLPSDRLRRALLAVSGIGPETADDILLYAFARPVFVVDAYTRRIGERLGLLEARDGYETIRARFESALGLDVALFNELHALLVRHGKEVCRPRPRCQGCVLAEDCPSVGMGVGSD